MNWQTKLTYNWLHIPTGKTGQTDRVFELPTGLAEKELLSLMSQWNSMSADWKYWR